MVTVTTWLRLGTDSSVLKKSSCTTSMIRKMNAFQKFLKAPQKRQHQIIIKKCAVCFLENHILTQCLSHTLYMSTKKAKPN